MPSLLVLAATRDLCVGGQDLEPPHCVAIRVGEVEPVYYVGICVDLCRDDVAFSQPFTFTGQISDFEQNTPTGWLHFSLDDLNPSATDLEFHVSWERFEVGRFSKESRIPFLGLSEVAHLDFSDRLPDVD